MWQPAPAASTAKHIPEGRWCSFSPTSWLPEQWFSHKWYSTTALSNVSCQRQSRQSLTLYLNQVSQQAQQQQQHHHLTAQQNALFGSVQPAPGELSLDVPAQSHLSGHGQSASISNGYPTHGATSGATMIGGLLAPGNPRGQHNRAVSLPVLNPGFENGSNSPNHGLGSNGNDGERRGHHYQASYGGMGAGFGLAIQGGLNQWVEEEVAN